MPVLIDGALYCEECAGPGGEEVFGGESDSPEHCGDCHRPLDYTLTGDGVAYVLVALQESIDSGREAFVLADHWEEGQYYHGGRMIDVVADWADVLENYGLDGADSLILEAFQEFRKAG